jgi:hypothetical protein
MLPYVPSSEHWLASAKTHFGLSEDHPKVARIWEILRKKEAGEITLQEHKEFQVLNDQLTNAHEFLYGKKMYPSGEVAYYPEMMLLIVSTCTATELNIHGAAWRPKS